MCYSFKTSIVSYSLGMASAIFAFFTRQYILGSLILFFCQMQLSEAIIWKGIDDNDISLNKTGTSYGQYLLPSHLFAVGLGYLIVVVKLHNEKLKPKYFIPVLIGLLFYFAIIFGPYRTENYPNVTYPANKSCLDKSCQNNENRLQWPYPLTWYVYGFILYLVFTFLFMKPLGSQILLSTIFIGTLLLALFVYPHSSGSVWCFAAAILAPVMVIGNYFIIRNKKDSDICT